MSTTLPARVEEYTALQAQSSFTDAEKAAFKELHEYITTHLKEDILWYWELGQKVAKVYTAAKENAELYGKQLLLRLAMGLGFKTDRQLRNAMDVCRAFKTKKAFNEYLKMRGEAGNMLQWTHLVYLSAIGDADLRMQLAAATLEQAWTADELWTKVKELCQRRSRGTRSPVTKIPSSARSCLTHVLAQATKFNFNFDNAWTGDAFDLRKLVQETPVTKLNEKLLASVQSTRQSVQAMQTRAIELSNILSSTEADIQARLEAQAALEAQQSAEDAEDDDADAEATPQRPPRQKRKKGKPRPGRVGTSS